MGVCSICGRKSKKTDIHHSRYAYPTAFVKKNPMLVLDYGFEVCFNPCHKLADALRVEREADPALRYAIRAMVLRKEEEARRKNTYIRSRGGSLLPRFKSL